MTKLRLAALVLLIAATLLPTAGAAAEEGLPASLSSLTVSPPPQGQPVPFDPANRGFGGEYESNPVEITVTAVPQDPAATFTIGGRPGVSGQPMTFAWDEWTPWFYLLVEIMDSDGANGEYEINLFKHIEFPSVGVTPNYRQIQAGGFDANSTLTMTIRSAPGGAVLTELTSASAKINDWEGNGHFVFTWELPMLGIPLLLQPGMEVRVSNGDMTATHVILPLTVDEVDFATDTIRITASPGVGLELFIWQDGDDETAELFQFGAPWPFPEGGGQYQEPNSPSFTVDAAGHWEVDLRPAGVDITPGSEIDILSSIVPDWGNPEGRASFDPKNHAGGSTSLFWPSPDAEELGPEITVILDLNAAVLEGVSPGINVGLTVRASAGGEVLFTDSQPADAIGNAGWGVSPVPEVSVAELGVVLVPGMEVSLTWGETTRTAVLEDVRVDTVDHETDRVSGIGPAGEAIALVLLEPDGNDFVLVAVAMDIPIGTDGSWQVTFTEDITVGMTALAILHIEGTFRTGAARTAVFVPVVIEENESVVAASDDANIVVSSVAGDGSLAEVSVPAAALPSGSTVRVAAISNTADLIAQVALPEGTDIALGFSISAEAADGSAVSAGFAIPVVIEFTVEADSLPDGYDPDNLSIAFWNGVRWAALEGVQAATNPDGSVTLTALTDHFTLFTVVADPTGAIKPGPANPLEEVTLTGLSSLGLAPASGSSDSDLAAGGFRAAVVWIIVGAAAVFLSLGWVILRRRRQPAGS